MKFAISKIHAFLFFFITCKLGFCQLTLENIFLYKKYEPHVRDEIHFLNQKAQFAKLEDKDNKQYIRYYNANNELQKTILLKEDITWDNFSFSNTDKFVLLQTGTQSVFRRSDEANYLLLKADNSLEDVSKEKILFPTFSPDDSKIAFIRDNNIFFKDLSSNKEIQATKDGKKNAIINGRSDWVYEEELELTQAYFWNPTSTQIAYLKFDESQVKEYSFPVYGSSTYPQNFTYKYPLAGEENSKVSVCLYDVKKKKNTTLNIPFSYEYICHLYWNNNGTEIYLVTLNRAQNDLQINAYSLKTKKWQQLYKETSASYVELPKSIKFLSDNSFFILSEKDGYNQIYHYDRNGKLKQQLTHGEQNVKEVYFVDEKTNSVYYQMKSKNGLEDGVHVLNYNSLQTTLFSKQQGYNEALFSNDGSFYFNTFSNAQTPPIITLNSVNAKTEVVIEDNNELRDALKDIPQKTFTALSINGETLNTFIIQPAHFDSTKKYPVLMYLYGGPGIQEVENKWSVSKNLWLNYLAQQGYYIVCVDNRGTGGKSAAFKKCTYLQLGKIETEDQIAVASYLGTLPYIDKTRIGIFGWSYGGFMAANCLFEGNTVFKTAIAVAPVSNWALYDNIYTERYMRTPAENKKGYLGFCPNSLAKKLKGSFLLIHGTGDDNVHFQNTIDLINALQEAHKPFELYIYPDKTHSIIGNGTRYDLFGRMTEFLKANL